MTTGAAAASPPAMDVRTVAPATTAAASRLASNAARSRLSGAERVEHEVRMQELPVPHAKAVAEAAEVVGWYERVGAEDSLTTRSSPGGAPSPMPKARWR